MINETKQATMSQVVLDDTLDPGGSVNTANKPGDLLPVLEFILSFFLIVSFISEFLRKK